MQTTNNSSVFWVIMPCSPLKVDRRFGGIFPKYLQDRTINQVRFTLVPFLAYSSKVKMKAICSSETSVDVQWTTRRYITED
jgi:hypothetical protein